jgi:hypothetical protein
VRELARLDALEPECIGARDELLTLARLDPSAGTANTERIDLATLTAAS